jgi:hypothetical protein
LKILPAGKCSAKVWTLAERRKEEAAIRKAERAERKRRKKERQLQLVEEQE